jgi:hypothetical protein
VYPSTPVNFELIQDFPGALAVMPSDDGITFSEELQERDERAARWTKDIFAHAKAE